MSTAALSSVTLSHLDWLESEAIHIMREVAGEFERPALLFSGGKDSICLLRLAEKAFSLGESDLTTLLRVRAGAFEAEAFLNRQQVARAAAQSRLKQVLGVLP